MAKDPSEIQGSASFDWGFDYSLLKSNLLLSPEERLRRHQEALDLVLEMRHAGQRLGYGLESAAEDSGGK